MMKKIFFTALALIICGCAFAQPSEADFILLQKDYVLNPDGSMDLHCRQVIKYNTHASFNRLYGETFIVYNPQQQGLKINESYTVQAGGNKITTPPNAFNEVLPRFAADAPAYNHLREMVVTHTGLEIGATTYLDYTLHTNAGYEPELDKCLSLQEDSPVKEYIVTVTTPGSKKLAYQLSGMKVNPKIVSKIGTTSYEWTFRNVAASSREPYQPEDNRNIPHLVFSTWPSQQAALHWLAGQIQAGDTKEIQAVFGAIPVKEKDSANPIHRLTNAYKYLTDNIAYTPVPVEYAGYRFRTASQVVTQAYGTAGEKMVLLLAVAKELGMRTYPVAVYPSYIDGSVGSLSAIADFAVAVDGDEKDYLLSPINYSTCHLAAFKPNRNYIALETAEKITCDKYINGESTITIHANAEQVKAEGASYLTTVSRSSQSLEKQTQGEFKETTVPQAKLSVSESGGYYSFTLPETRHGANSWALSYLASSRKTTLEIPYPLVESNSYELFVPDDMTFINKESLIVKENRLGGVKIIIEQIAPNHYKVFRSLELRQSIIATTDYNGLLELLNIWRNPAYRTIVFK